MKSSNHLLTYLKFFLQLNYILKEKHYHEMIGSLFSIWIQSLPMLLFGCFHNPEHLTSDLSRQEEEQQKCCLLGPCGSCF